MLGLHVTCLIFWTGQPSIKMNYSVLSPVSDESFDKLFVLLGRSQIYKLVFNLNEIIARETKIFAVLSCTISAPFFLLV